MCCLARGFNISVLSDSLLASLNEGPPGGSAEITKIKTNVPTSPFKTIINASSPTFVTSTYHKFKHVRARKEFAGEPGMERLRWPVAVSVLPGLDRLGDIGMEWGHDFLVALRFKLSDKIRRLR